MSEIPKCHLGVPMNEVCTSAYHDYAHEAWLRNNPQPRKETPMVDWIADERRKLMQKLADVQSALAQRDQRIVELEAELARTVSQWQAASVQWGQRIGELTKALVSIGQKIDDGSLDDADSIELMALNEIVNGTLASGKAGE